jgi:predicted O-linked N-acetylglucosamine transferase (SPINDLY family)
MLRGTQLHSADQLEQALLAFENALALAPQDVNTASACATLLTLLDRPQAAYRTLLSVESLLMGSADGAANLAIAAEACGDLSRAQDAYAQALQFDPNHLRSLNNVGILAASSSQWELAITLARKCLALQPAHPPYHANLAEFLSGARRYPEALEVVTGALAEFPHWSDLKVRHIALLAFSGELEKADAALGSLDAGARQLFEEFLSKLSMAENLSGPTSSADEKTPSESLDAFTIHTRQAFRDMALADWRNQDRLTGILGKALAEAGYDEGDRDWHDAPFYGLMLGLQEEELAQMRRESTASIKAAMKATLPAFVPRRNTVARKKDARIHVGLAIPSLRDTRMALALTHQLSHHDASRFVIHVYAFTSHPEAQLASPLLPHAESVAELAHMTDAEAAARMRLDQLDIYVEMAGDSAWSRPKIAACRVAPVQLRHPGCHRDHVPGLWDYTLSDSFIHLPEGDPGSRGAIARMPYTCWLASEGETGPIPSRLREETGLPADALVICSLLHPATLDTQSFSAWMKILRSLPDAVLWLPGCAAAGANLVREAQGAGVGANRLLFSGPMSHSETLAGLRHADIYLDPLRFNSAPGLEDALRLGLPALTCAGTTMASRLSGSLLHAGGLPECVFDNPQAYIHAALHLGRDAGALTQLRERLQRNRPCSLLFDIASRIREWEAAWIVMVGRSRAGIAPAAFDVPSSDDRFQA